MYAHIFAKNHEGTSVVKNEVAQQADTKFRESLKTGFGWLFESKPEKMVGTLSTPRDDAGQSGTDDVKAATQSSGVSSKPRPDLMYL